MNGEQFEALLAKFTAEQISESEYAELLQAVHQGSFDDRLKEGILADLRLADMHPAWTQAREATVWEGITESPSPQVKIVHRVHFLRTAWFRYAAAVILLLGIGGYILWSDRTEIPAKGWNDKGDVVQPKTTSNNKAILTLADGSQIILDNKTNGNIAQQGTTQIIKLDGNQLTYNGNPKKTSPPAMEGTVFDPREAGQKPGVAPLYNTITTPRGSQYQIILPDGTKAWLNAASSIKFPTTFTGNQRKIETTGEIYLEVAVNKSAPFVVTTKGMEVHVLGTSFNISAYEDEEIIKTTLVQGSIKVTNPGRGVILVPGQQAVMTNLSDIHGDPRHLKYNGTPNARDDKYGNIKIQTIDIDQVIAWKDSWFYFSDADIKEIMRQVARWYDVEVEYEGAISTEKFKGKIARTTSLNDLMKILEINDIKWALQGRKLKIRS